jgi:hypothetical protein
VPAAAAGPPGPERPERDAVGAGPLGDEQRGEQVPAEHEERVDAEIAADGPRLAAVVHHHGEDRERADAVERGLVRDAGRPASARRRPRPDTLIVADIALILGTRRCGDWARRQSSKWAIGRAPERSGIVAPTMTGARRFSRASRSWRAPDS